VLERVIISPFSSVLVRPVAGLLPPPPNLCPLRFLCPTINRIFPPQKTHSCVLHRVLPQSFTIQLIVVVCTELLEADPSIVVRVDPIHQLLCPLLVVLREGGVDFFHREKSIVVCVRLLFKELLPRGLLRTPQPFLVPCTLGTDVVVAEEAIEPVVAVVGLGKDLVAGGARLAVPGPLHLWPEPQFLSTLAEDIIRLRHCFQFSFSTRCVGAHPTMASVVPQKVVDLIFAEVA